MITLFNYYESNKSKYKSWPTTMRSLIEIWFHCTWKWSPWLKEAHFDVFKICFGFPLLMNTAKASSYFLDLNIENMKEKGRLLMLDIKGALAIMSSRFSIMYEKNVLFIVICVKKIFLFKPSHFSTCTGNF